ncbi:DUF6625 family protein [Carnobacterium inhibens]|uniref:Uncharacterized protein n=1 Tax=Carnobacterium inhibens subsp. gilichinskyi TaxID=1266845 RepID=U5S9I7_9LACT|nr:DUF6625 family protein [Carnobacterium inhibens]AGY81954.1 hypothetical protein Q783_06990 [Carnobacterium inhibens subsp. gilichinskyi]
MSENVNNTMKKLKSIGIILPYFGKFPNYFNLWLKSCALNSTIDFYIFTDDRTSYDFPNNVHVTYLSFDDIKKRFDDSFNFSIVLPSAYKLCDFRPAYGYIFNEELSKYDYWGYCDCDLIFGNIRKFITEDVLNLNDKIFQRGHLSIIRNTPENNNIFKKKLDNKFLFKDVFQDEKSSIFDEKFYNDNGGINGLFLDNGKEIFIDDNIVADINIKHKFFHVNSDKSKDYITSIFYFSKEENNCGLYRYSCAKGNITQKEYIYIHLQKRKMNVQGYDKNDFFIIPNEFIKHKEIDKLELLKRFKRDSLFYPHYYMRRYFKFIKKISTTLKKNTIN